MHPRGDQYGLLPSMQVDQEWLAATWWRSFDRNRPKARLTHNGMKNSTCWFSRKKNRITGRLDEYKSAGKTIAGFGASHSTTTLTYEFGLTDYLDYIVDDNPDKHGTFSPGAKIPVYPSSHMQCSPPDCIVLLAWQHAKTIYEKYRHQNRNIDWIIPFSEFKEYL